MTRHIARIALALVLSAFVVNVGAQVSMPLSAALAQQIVSACVEHATHKKQSHAIAVVDNSGALLAFLRMDGNPTGVGDFAMQKAVAVASWRLSTQQMARAAETTPGFALAPKVVTVAGRETPVTGLPGSGRSLLAAMCQHRPCERVVNQCCRLTTPASFRRSSPRYDRM